MEQKSVRLKRLGLVALIFLALAIVGDLVDVYEAVKGTAHVGYSSSYALDPYQNVIITDNNISGLILGFVKIILPIANSVVLGMVLLRIIHTGVPFSCENKKVLRLYGILVMVQAFFVLFSGMFSFSKIPSFFISCVAAIIWFCWPGSSEENPQNVLRNRQNARILHIIFILLQITISIDVVWYILSVLEIFERLPSMPMILYIVLGILSSCVSVLYYNRFGQVFESVGIGASKFDAANIKRIKTAAHIMFIFTGAWAIVSSCITVVNISDMSRFMTPANWILNILNTIVFLTIPLAVLFLAFAYEHGASEKIEIESTEIQ